VIKIKLDKIKIKTKTINESDSDTYITPSYTTIKINEKVLPYVRRFNLEHSADEIAGPTLNLELAIFEDMLEYNGKGKINLESLFVESESLAYQVYENLKERFEDDNE